MGYTFCFLGGSGDAVEGVFGDGRKASVCGASIGRRADGGTLQGIWNLPVRRVQDLHVAAATIANQAVTRRQHVLVRAEPGYSVQVTAPCREGMDIAVRY